MKRYILTIIGVLCSYLSSMAFVEVYSKHLNALDGLANNTVRTILQDSKGFVWLGTLNGLSRYDGNTFVNFQEGDDTVPALGGHRIRNLWEGANGLLWIDDSSERHSCYDLKLGTFVDFTGCGEYREKYKGAMQATNGDVWLYHDLNGCRRVSFHDGVFTSIAFKTSEKNISFNDVRDVVEDAKGRIWIVGKNKVALVKGDLAEDVLDISSPFVFSSATHTFFVSRNGVIFLEEGEKIRKVAAIDEDYRITVNDGLLLKDKFYLFASEGGYCYDINKATLQRSKYLDIKNIKVEKDNKGNYWLYNHTGWLWYVNAETGVIKPLQLQPKESMPYLDGERYSFVHDSRDIIWISTYGNGLFAYDLKTDELQHFKANLNGVGHISSDYLLCVMEDNSGGIWVSSEFSGVSRLSIINQGATYFYPEGLSNKDDRSNSIRLLKTVGENIWVGTRRGDVYLYDKEFHRYEKKNYPANIYAVAEDAKGRLWMGSRGNGLYIDGKWYKYRPNDASSLSASHIFDICRDDKGRMWIGVFNGGLDLAVEDVNGEYTFRHFLNKNYNQRQIRALIKDNNGYIWVGSSAGVAIFYPDSLIADSKNYFEITNEKKLLGSGDVKAFCLDSKGNMWIATSGAGLYKCSLNGLDYEHLTIQHYSLHNGLVSDMVQAVVEDKQGRIWVSTEYGVSCLDVDSETIENHFFSSHILGNSYCDNTACVTDKGEILFGSNYGFVLINPKSEKPTGSMSVPEVVMTALNINGSNVRPGENDSPLLRDISYTRSIELKYNQNSFEIDFSTLDFSVAGLEKYRYKLDKYDKGWSVPSTLSFATYKNMPSGTYVFRVQASNDLGIWGEETVLNIKVLPPFWKTGWAYLLYALLVLAIIFLFFRFTALRNRIAIEKQLTEYKLVFFTNISHEFRTPLTLIQGALENLKSSNLSKENAESMKIMDKSTKRMLRLINQLLEFRKMQNNKLALSLEETEVISFLYEIFLTFKDSADSKKMLFLFDTSVKNYRMYVDKEKLDKVTYNLLSNAFKYTPTGGKIVFSVRVDELVGQLQIKVSDTGVGIPKEKQTELFKRFMQSSFSGSSVGVGLHLSHELVNVHKGNIIYTENPEGGSVFTVTIPTDISIYEKKNFLIPNQLQEGISRQQTLAVADELATDELTISEIVPLNKHRILIIEDDTDVREFLKQEVGRYFEVMAEPDGKAGIERVATYDADLIICDVLMPGMNGFEVTRHLKKDFNTCHIPVVLLTALSAEEKQLEGANCGADLYVIKPFSPRLLLTRICKLIEQREKLREKFSNDPTSIRPTISSSEQDKLFAEHLQAILEKQLGNPDFTIDDFANSMKLGRTVFYRKVRGVTGYSPNEYIRIVRMKKAASLLQNTTDTIAEVAYQVGMNDPFYFSKCFKQQFGVSPSAFRKGDEL
ncbi:MAG: response regulator [Mediterranea massiliensis]|nr:response regulator [Mediterranea massiliensis]